MECSGQEGRTLVFTGDSLTIRAEQGRRHALALLVESDNRLSEKVSMPVVRLDKAKVVEGLGPKPKWVALRG
jgi:hypothetical protein